MLGGIKMKNRIKDILLIIIALEVSFYMIFTTKAVSNLKKRLDQQCIIMEMLNQDLEQVKEYNEYGEYGE